MLLADRRVVITGATGGLGQALARCCAREGATVGLGYHQHPEIASALAAELAREHGRQAHALHLNVTDPAGVAAAVARFCALTGGLDGWVSNAAVQQPSLLLTADEAALRQQLEVNLLGPMWCARAVLPVMMRARAGVLLHISSVAATRPSRGQAAYAASKGGLEALTRALAVEYARKGVRVLGLRPGPIDTPMLEAARRLGERELLARTPLRRLATPTEVAEVAVFLLSCRASYATGSIVDVDGGYQVG